MPAKNRLEICVDSVASALAAQAGGADRVELCQNLFEGGTTPSAGLIQTVRQKIRIGLFVLIRPRGGDFCYTEDESAVMEEDIRVAKTLGAEGIVTGALQPDGTVDRKQMRRLLALARPLPVTFHRAFDMTRDPERALQTLIELGCERVLTSGQEKSVLEGIEQIAALIKKFGGRIIVMPGGGISRGNFARIRKLSGAVEFHLSASTKVESAMKFRNPRCFMGRELRAPEYAWSMTDAEQVRQIRRILGGA